MALPAATCSAKSPADAMKELTFVLRSDLHVSRQVHQGQPVYVVHDPVSFKTHRLPLSSYQLFVRLDPSKKLDENFDSLVRQNHLRRNDRDSFFQLILQLQQLNLLVLPVANGNRLHEQYLKQTNSRRRSKLLGALFMTIPLARPDEFLTRTAHRVRWMFTQGFLAAWAVAGLCALWLVVNRFEEFTQPFNGLLATDNLPFLWAAFVVLKVWHELGHAYACKIHGGAVPEMGMILIAGTPAAYVDATSAWSFPERWKRLVVMVGGMYFESIVAIPAVFVWAFATSPLLTSCAWQLVMMASLITLLFNANPLMKYDGYFIASELVGIQNLRGRADQYLKAWMKRIFLGLESGHVLSSGRQTVASAGESVRGAATGSTVILAAYGIAAAIYRTLLIFGIAAMIATRFPMIGLALAAFHLVSTLGSSGVLLGKYLLTSSETASVRGRARLLAVFALIVVPLMSLVVPVPFGVVAQGVVAAESEYFLNAETPGTLLQSFVNPGNVVNSGALLAELENSEVNEQAQLCRAELQEALLQWEVSRSTDITKSAELEARITELKHRLLESQKQVSALRITAPAGGRIARVVSSSQKGRYLKVGDQAAVVVDGRSLLRTWLNEDELGSIQREPGTEVRFRIPGRSETTFVGRLVSIEPAAESTALHDAMTFAAGGTILLNPKTGLPLEPLFQVDISPSNETVLQLADHGMRLSLQIPRRYESFAAWGLRRVMRFVQKTLLAR
ncbi:MAG: HlyD family efflux transporter periplasmic adaptor subunit [Planctomycetaceae bacterium]